MPPCIHHVTSSARPAAGQRFVRRLFAFWLTLPALAISQPAPAQVTNAAARSRVNLIEKLEPLFALPGHGERVFTVPFSPNGQRIASASSDKTVRIWDAAAAGTPILTLNPGYEVYCAAFSPDGKRLATAGGHSDNDDQKHRPGEVQLWDVATGKEILRLPNTAHAQVVFRAAFSPDGTRLATASADHTVKVWDAATGKDLLTLQGHTTTVYDVGFSPDGKRLVSAAGNFFARTTGGEVKVWDLAGGKELLMLKSHGGSVYSAVFSPDGKRLATAGGDHTVRLWDAATGKELATLRGYSGQVYHVAFSPDGRFLAAAGSGTHGTIRIWNLSLPGLPLAFQGHGTEDVYSVAFRPDGKRLATGGGDRSVRVWDIAPFTETTAKGSAPRTRKDLEPFWADLGSPEIPRVYRALWTLAASPKEAVPFLHGHFLPPTAADPRIGRLIDDLNSDSFAVRDKAHRELEKLGPAAEPALRRTLANPASQEVRRRVERLLDRKNQQLIESPDVQRLLRVIKLLEHFGTAEARNELENLGKGAFGETIAQEAKAALERLDRETPGQP